MPPPAGPGTPPAGGPGMPPAGGPGMPPPGGPGGPPTGGEPASSKGGAGKIIAIVVGLLVLIGGAVGVWMLLSGDDDAEVAVDDAEDTDVDPDAADGEDVEAEGDEDADGAPGDGTVARPIDGPIETNQVYEQVITADTGPLRVTFDAVDGAILDLRVSNDRASERRVIVELTSAGDRFARFIVDAGASVNEEVILDHASGGTFELEFLEGPAAFQFEVAMDQQQDGGQAGDAGDDFGSAFTVAAGTPVTGLLGGNDTTDVFLVELPPGQLLTFELSNARESDRRVIYEVVLDGQRILREIVNAGATSTETYLFSGETSGVLEVIVFEGPASYVFQAELTEQQDGGQPGDAGDEIGAPREVPVGEQLAGQVGDDDPQDVYVFAALADEHTLVVANDASSPRRIIFEVEDLAGSRVAREIVNAGSDVEVSLELEAGEEYRLRVFDGRADYTFELR